jgi:peptidyl-prolyl cis-trans isomerase A (cyclophilin A)
MQRTLGLALVIVAFSWSAWTQAKPATTTPPHRAAAKPAPVDENAPDPIAIIDTTVGKMTCTLYPKKAPVGVANFIGLSTGTKDWTNPTTHKKMHGVALYDGTIFHRVIPNFMIQGGDAQGNGRGEPGYNFQNETSPDLTFDRPGRLAYANRGPDTNGSQFFITEVPYPSLNGGYTIFGQCDDASVALVKQIARVAKDPSNDMPLRPVKINHITIVKAGGTATAAAPKAAPKKPATGAKSPAAPTTPPK